MYFKGTWMLQTFRHVLNNDTLFFAILRGLQDRFKYTSTYTNQVLNYINTKAGKDYSPFFNQYLYKPNPPIFEYKLKQDGRGTLLTYRWDSVATDFEMPLIVRIKGKTAHNIITKGNSHKEAYAATIEVPDSDFVYIRIIPSKKWKTDRLPYQNPTDFSIDLDEFYVIPKKDE
jgi:aminopeptidase N